MKADVDFSVPPVQSVGIWQAFLFWLKLGFISFGGPAGQIAIMHQELVQRRKWISEGRFLHALNYCMVLPGPEAQQLATYIGWLMHRTYGGLIAGILFILPSLIILIVLSWIYIRFGHVGWVAGVFSGIKPAVAAIVLQAAHRIGGRTLTNNWLWGIALAAFVAIFVFNIPFPLIVFLAALIGYCGAKWAPDYFKAASGHGSNKTTSTPALIDDNSPTPEHAQFKLSRFYSVLAVGCVLWAVPMLLLYTVFGWDNNFTQMAWFFTKAALLTFGGAYAVLPYVYQGAVSEFAWLTPTQMIDGLALGETTPGPLIMVVAFAGFVGAYVKAQFGLEWAFVAGCLGAVVVTWFTFLPSFIFIFAGAPFIETTHNNLGFTAPLTAITAAVVGVIVNLGLFFGYHVFWPTGFSGVFEWMSAIMALGALIALIRFKISVIKVIAACAGLGLLKSLLLQV